MHVKPITNVLIAAAVSAALFSPAHATPQSSDAWTNISSQQQYQNAHGEVLALDSVVFAINYDAIAAKMQQASKSNGIHLTVPDNQGKFHKFRLIENTTFPSELKKKYPNIRSYSAINVENAKLTGRFELSPNGVSGMYRQANGDWVFIDPVPQHKGAHRVYNASQARTLSKVRLPDQVEPLAQAQGSEQARADDFGEQLRSYRIAVSAAGEFTQYHGGSVADGLAAINTTINRVNEIYNRDLAIQLNLVANNDQLVFTDPATDPFANDTGDITTNGGVIDGEIGNGSYDIGHIVNTAGGGLAGLGVVCSSSFKARGVTGLSNPINDVFYIDYVAHEIGHQFRANHTFNGGVGSCGSNRAGSAAYEPGSGSTIMSYAGICGEQNIQNNSDALFHTYSIDEVRAFITNGGGSTCGTLSSLNNNPPSANAGNNRVIPANTPFMLSGTASDNDGDTLTYTWEQLDLGPQTSSQAEMVDDGSRPLFRTFLPSESDTRYFPQLSNVVAGTSNFREVLPTTNRTMNFRFTVRDGVGGVVSDDITVTSTTSAGPFSVTSPATNATLDGGMPYTVTWNVANTNSGNVNCSSVDIDLSDDGGVTFALPVISGTSNDGSEEVILPNSDIANARIMVSCPTQGFFNVSPVDFSITQSAGIPVITGQQDLSTNEDEAITVSVNDLTIDDSDSSSFTLTLLDGDNYSVAGAVVTPDSNYNGTLTVNARVNDGTYDSALFPLAIDVLAVNDAPEITSAASGISFLEDTSITLQDNQFSITDPDDSSFTVVVQAGANYTANGAQVTPAANFTGALPVSVQVSDGDALSNSFTIELTVTPQNDAPQANNDNFSVAVNSGGVTLNVLANDVEIDAGDSILITSVTYTGSGVLIINGSQDALIYSPGADFEGTESFSYEVTDTNGATSTASATITVSGSSSGSGGGSMSWLALVGLALAALRRRR